MNTSNTVTSTHPLEHNAVEKYHFLTTLDCSSQVGRSAYRRAVEVTTGYLPTWAERKKAGRPTGSKNRKGIRNTRQPQPI